MLEDTINEWLAQTVNNVIEALRHSNDLYYQSAHTGQTDKKSLDEAKKQRFLKSLLDQHHGYTFSRIGTRSGRKPSELHRIIQGFLTEFVNQTENGVTPCNIVNDRNPEAASYWQAHPAEEFEEAKFRGMFHSAAALKRLGNKPDSNGRYGALSDIIKTSIQVFNERYPELNPTMPPNPSVYNNPHAIADLITRMESRSLTRAG